MGMFRCCVRHGSGADGTIIDLIVVGFARRAVMDLPFFVVSISTFRKGQFEPLPYG